MAFALCGQATSFEGVTNLLLLTVANPVKEELGLPHVDAALIERAYEDVNAPVAGVGLDLSDCSMDKTYELRDELLEERPRSLLRSPPSL